MGADGPRMDASGTNQLCELCGRQLHKVKHHRPHGVGRACKKHLIPGKPSPVTAPVAESVPVRSHKRKDIPHYDHARRCYTVLLYLTSTRSTALPTRPLAELRGTFTHDERKLP